MTRFTLLRSASVAAAITLVLDGCAARLRPLDEQPGHGRCTSSQLLVVENHSSHAARVVAVEDHINSPPHSSELVTTVAAGATDTIGYIARQYSAVHVSFEDQQYISGMPVPIRGLSVSCIAPG